jgi:DinB superfamily
VNESGPGPRTAVDEMLARVEVVQDRLEEHASSEPAPGLTTPDPPTGERWDWGQVWAHLAEFVPYWCGEVRLILGTEGSDPVPFGRVKSDPVRVAAIEADRHRPPRELMDRLVGQLEELRSLIRSLSSRDWERRGRHSTLGVMGMRAVFDEFLVGHLEAHADQLDGLRTDGDSG